MWFIYFISLSSLYSNEHEYLYISNIMQYCNKQTSLTEQNLETDSNTFTLKKLINNYRIHEVSVIFPIVNRSLDQQQTQESDLDQVAMNSYPVFNHDMKYFTPCFVVDADRFKVQKTSDLYLDHHLQRLNEVDEQKSQILVPKPSKNHTTCSLCKTNYQDYLQHINSEAHLAKQKKSKIYKNIEALCKLMQKREKRMERNQKKLQRQNQKIKQQRKNQNKRKQIEKQKKKAVQKKQTEQEEIKQPTQISQNDVAIYLDL